jgi:hypothetical protein
VTHTFTVRKNLDATISDEEWERIKNGETIPYIFHPMWLHSGFLCVFVGKNVSQDDPEAVALMRDGADCASYPIDTTVILNFETGGATTAEYGPFSVTFLLDRIYNKLKQSVAEPSGTGEAQR